MLNIIRLSLISVIAGICEFLFIYLYFFIFFDYPLGSYSKAMAENSLKLLDYSISKAYVKPMIMSIRDYISWNGEYKQLLLRKDKIEEILKNNFLTSDAYYLSKAIVDDGNRPFYLKSAKQTNDIYIKYIAEVYYYVLVSREFTEALGTTFNEMLNKIPANYRWILDLIKQPTIKFAREYIIGKLKETAKVSSDPVLSSLCIGLLISLDYTDEKFYNYFLGSSYPVLFVTSTVGLYVTGRKSKLLEHSKYSYFILNKPDLYRYYSTLLILKYTEIYPQVYLSLMNFDILRDFNETTICIVMLLN
ncbi:MAG: hypothetical protein RMJ51_03440 [Candidatus Calescibacterium sp.]|nr:hypothetical protein [Candidatus Calescibacterium sp.]MDW8195279.1 hypothetical protein [Candidatus Calescibacterium sp.]